MCDYSLQNVKSRTAQVGDKLMTRNFGGAGTQHPEDLTTAVCLLPGTELAFSNPVVICGLCSPPADDGSYDCDLPSGRRGSAVETSRRARPTVKPFC